MRYERLDYPITNKYTFACVFSNPDNARPLLEAVLGVSVGKIRLVEPERAVQPSLRSRGVRMDVFVEDGLGTVYDVEMQNVDEGNLALRSRYLLSSFDRDRIVHGDDYLKLGKSVVIFVCCFDPIGLGDRMYVVQPSVVGRWQTYDDGTMRVFLNAKGASTDRCGSGELSDKPRVASFLSYVDGGDTMDDEWVKGLDREVRALNEDEGWRNTVLGLQLDIEHDRRVAREEGLAEGREAGLAEADRVNRALAEALSGAGRLDELAGALCDDGRRAALLREFGIR